MSSEFRDLYQEVIIDHSKHPRNFRVLDPATRKVEAVNPLCGDQLTLYVKLDGHRIEDISFEGAGCAISKASTSLMTETLKGKTDEEAIDLFDDVHLLLTEGPGALAEPKNLGKLAVLSGVSEFPARVKCASLGWHALKSALEASDERVSTE
jgi:nitrogen fixation protein NifU and related proteins